MTDAELVGFRLKPDWFRENRDSVFPRVLNQDLSVTSQPIGLDAFLKQPKYRIETPVVLQVNEITDASLARPDREALKMSPSGTLRLLLSDGATEFIGIAKGRFTLLNPASKPGVKIKTNAPVEMRYGVLFLSDDVVSVLGGFSPELEDKRSQIFNPRRVTRPPPPPQDVEPQTNPPPPTAPSSGHSTQFLMSSEDFSLSETESDDDKPATKPASIFLDDDDDESDIIEIETPDNYVTVKSLRDRSLESGSKWEVVRVNARVVDCFDFTFNKRGDKFLFHLLCKIVDETGFMVIRVAPLLLEQVIGVSPSVMVKKTDDEKGAVFRKLKDYFMNMRPPLVLIQRERFKREEDKFVLTNEDLAQEIATASYES